MPAPTYDSTVKAARMTATRDEVASGSVELLDASNNALAVVNLTAAAGSVTGDTWTLAFDGTGTGTAAAGTGTTATTARIKNSGGTTRISNLSVGATGSGSAVELSNTSIAEGQTVEFTGGTITHAPDPA